MVLLALATVLVLVSPALGEDGATTDRVVGPSGPAVGPSGLVTSPDHRSARQLLPATGGTSDLGDVDVPLGGTNEPTITIDPNDTDRVAMASLFTSRVSTDGGATWTAETALVVPVGYGGGGDPSLAYDSQGRLFWSYLGVNLSTGTLQVLVSELNPVTGAVINGPVLVTPGVGFDQHDKQWLAIDTNPSSPFTDRLYLAWTVFLDVGGTQVLSAWSSDQGATWSTPLPLSPGDFSEGFVWPTHTAVGPDGDVFVSYHGQTGFVGNPDGTSGKVFVCRSVDGGVSFPQKTEAFADGDADVTYNVQTEVGTIPLTNCWMQGSPQAWVLPDPHKPAKLYVVCNDDPDDVHGSGDDADVVMAISTDDGLTWGPPITVEAGPSDSFQIFPTASIDPITGCIVIAWYDNRGGAFNGNGLYLLDVYTTRSFDEGATFLPPEKVNDAPFDPELDAPLRFSGPPPTLRIGEYIGIASREGQTHIVWCGNDVSSQQTITDRYVGCPWFSLSGGSTGTGGFTPVFEAVGTLAPLSPLTLSLQKTPANTLVLLWLSFSSQPLGVLGGTVYANPFNAQFLRTTNGAGEFSQSLTWPAAIASDIPLYLQWLVQDQGVPAGITLSNALMAVTP